MTNDPNSPDYDPLSPVVLENGYTPRPADDLQHPQRAVLHKKARFIEVLAETCNITYAASQVGWKTASTAYYHYKQDENFKEAWDEALKIGAFKVQDVAFRLATEGYDEPVFHNGEEVGTKTKYPISLIEFMLKKHFPEVYGDKIDHSITVDAGVLVVPGMATAEDWENQAKKQQQEHRGPIIEHEAT